MNLPTSRKPWLVLIPAVMLGLTASWYALAADVPGSVIVGSQDPNPVVPGGVAKYQVTVHRLNPDLTKPSANNPFRVRLEVQWSNNPAPGATAFYTDSSLGTQLSNNELQFQNDTSRSAYLKISPGSGANSGNYAFKVRAIKVQGSQDLGSVISDEATLVVRPSDSVAPTTVESVSGTQGNNGWYRSNVTVALSASDTNGSGVDNTYYKLDGGAQQTYTAPFSVAGDAQHTVVFWSVDKAGNREADKSQAIDIDTTPPSIPQGSVDDADWRNTDRTQAFAASDALSGLANPADATFTLIASAESTLGAGGAAQPTTVSKTVLDLAGNSTTRTLSALIDKTQPVLTPGATQGIQGNLVGTIQWYRSDVEVPVTGSDALSGLLNPGDDMSFSLVTTGEGAAVATGSREVADKAGNKAVLGPLSFAVDKTAPAVSPDNVGNTTWRNTDLAQAFTASDAVSGLANTSDNSFTLTASAESASESSPTVVSRTVSDAAGNSTTRSVSGLIDKTAPVVQQGAITGEAGNQVGGVQWYVSDVTVSYTASDSLSGLQVPADASITLTTSGEGAEVSTGSKEVSDVAGNKATAGPRQFAVDKTAPVITGTPDRTPNTNGWYTAPVTYTFRATDNASGVAGLTEPIIYSGPDCKTASVTASAADQAGNSTSKSFSFKYDATDPVIQVIGVSEGAYLQNAAVQVGALDLALKTLTATINGVPIANPASFSVVTEGVKTLVINAEDEAGRKSTRTVKFTIDQGAPTLLFDFRDDYNVPFTGLFANRRLTLNFAIEDALDPNPLFTLQQLQGRLTGGDFGPVDITPGQRAAEEGEYTLNLQGRDTAGNGASASRTFYIDTQAPSTSASATGVHGNSGWFQSPVSLNLSASDDDIRPEAGGLSRIPGSGVNALAYWATGAQPINNTVVSQSSASFSITQEGITTLRYQAKDVAENEETIQELVIRYDKTAPELTVPADIVQEATGPEGAAVSFVAPAANDNVDGSPQVVCSAVSGATFPLGATLVTCTATDAAGNMVTKSFTITVQDTTPPEIRDVPANITTEATGPEGAMASWSAPSASDLVDAHPSVTLSHASGATFPLGETVVTVAAQDMAGNRASASFTVKVRDTTPPVIAAKEDVIAEATGPDGAAVTFTAPEAKDIVDGNVAVECHPTSGSVFPLGTSTVTVTAKDRAGNEAASSFEVIVRDTTSPAISGVPADMKLEATGPEGAVASWSAPSAADLVDGTVPVVSSHASGTTFPLGSTTVTLSVKDKAGNTDSKSFTVTVEDTTAPTLNDVGDITKEATGPTGAAINLAASASDIVDGSVPVKYRVGNTEISSGDIFPLGETVVSVTAQDMAGNRASASFTVKVQDTTPPALSGVADLKKEATGPSGAVVTFNITASDRVDGVVSVTCTPPSGSTFPLGTTVVQCDAADSRGNKIVGYFMVTVEDTTAPVVSGVADINTEAAGPSGAAVNFTGSATDVVDGSVTVSYSVGGNPVTSGSTFPLGVTTVSYSAKDHRGNEASGSFTVTVVDTTAPTLSGVPDNLSVFATSTAGAVVSWTAPTATDIVDGAVAATCSPASGSTFAPGAHTVTVKAKDAAGNTATKTFTVIVTYSWSGFLQPINAAGSRSVFKLGSTVPVKFKLTGASAGITGLIARFAYRKMDGTADALNEAADYTTPDNGGLFRYSGGEAQYIHNWGTKGLTVGTYEIRADLGDGVLRVVQIDLR